MKKKTFATIIILIAIVVFIGYSIFVITKKEPIILQGEIEATQIKISSKVPGRIDSLGVRKGQLVKQGDFMFSINSPEIEAKFAEATAAKNAAQAQERKANNGAQQEDIQAAYSSYIKAEAAANFAKKSFDRVQNLYHQGVVPEQKKDKVETQFKAARQTANAAKAIWQKAKNGARKEDKAAANAMVKRADAAIAQVEAYLNETTILSTVNAEVSGVNAENGELVGTGFPVVTLIDMNDIWATFYIREDYLPFFEKGVVFPAKIPGLGNKIVKFQVDYISPAGDFARWTATKASGDFDLKSFRIEARPLIKINNLRPGMTTIVQMDIDAK